MRLLKASSLYSSILLEVCLLPSNGYVEEASRHTFRGRLLASSSNGSSPHHNSSTHHNHNNSSTQPQKLESPPGPFGDATCMKWTGEFCSPDIYCQPRIGPTRCHESKCICEGDFCANALGNCEAGVGFLMGEHSVEFKNPADAGLPYLGIERKGGYFFVSTVHSSAAQWKVVLTPHGWARFESVAIPGGMLTMNSDGHWNTNYFLRMEESAEKNSKILLQMEEFAAAGGIALDHEADEAIITVRSARYGSNCAGGGSDQTEALSRACNGRTSCTYKVDHVIIGDPAPQCAKEFSVTYFCGGNKRSTALEGEASGQTVSLTCEGEVGSDAADAKKGPEGVAEDRPEMPKTMVPVVKMLKDVTPADVTFQIRRLDEREGRGFEIWHPVTQTSLASRAGDNNYNRFLPGTVECPPSDTACQHRSLVDFEPPLPRGLLERMKTGEREELTTLDPLYWWQRVAFLFILVFCCICIGFFVKKR